VRQFIYNNGDSEAHINVNVVARLPSRFEVWDWFSVEIGPNLPVPILVENEHLHIWQLLTALFAFLELKHSHLHIVSILNKQRKPRNILMRFCLLLFGLLSLVLFWQLTREWGVLWKGAFYKIPGLACRPTILPLSLLAGYVMNFVMSHTLACGNILLSSPRLKYITCNMFIVGFQWWWGKTENSS
jgi:hypothetical protein